MERRSSKGNPWHDAKGRFCHGPEATVDTFGNPITEEQRRESVCRSQQSKEYYDAKTRYRNGEISEEMFKELISKRATDTPSYDLFIESLPQRPDVSTPKKREALFREIAEKSGAKVDVPVRATKGKMRQGSVQFGAQPNGDNCTKSATKVTLSGAMSEDEERVETIYHEAYHFSANGGESDEYGYPYGRFERRRESCNMEEVMAVCSSYALMEDTGFSTSGLCSGYSKELVEILPRLKHNTDRYKNCNTIEDVGRIAWDERLCSKDSIWMPLHKESRSKPLPRGYYKGYLGHVESNSKQYIDRLTEDHLKLRPQDHTWARESISDAFYEGLSSLKAGGSPSNLTGNARIVFNNALFLAIKDMGIL